MGTVSDLRKGVMHRFMHLYVSSSIFPLQPLAYHVWASAAARFLFLLSHPLTCLSGQVMRRRFLQISRHPRGFRLACTNSAVERQAFADEHLKGSAHTFFGHSLTACGGPFSPVHSAAFFVCVITLICSLCHVMRGGLSKKSKRPR